MKIINPLKALVSKMRDKRAAMKAADIKRTADRDVVVGNDKNDPENRIYVFVCGVPVAEVRDVELDGENTILIDHVGEFVADIKKMYRNYLNDRPIK